MDLKSFQMGLGLGLMGKPLPITKQEKEPIAYLYNGVQLPGLPEWDKEAYPYAVMWNMTYNTPLLCAFSAPAMLDGSSGLVYITPSVTCKYCKWALYSTGWYQQNADSTAEKGNWSVSSLFSNIWTNHDIYDADGNLCLAASEPTPVYE